MVEIKKKEANVRHLIQFLSHISSHFIFTQIHVLENLESKPCTTLSIQQTKTKLNQREKNLKALNDNRYENYGIDKIIIRSVKALRAGFQV